MTMYIASPISPPFSQSARSVNQYRRFSMAPIFAALSVRTGIAVCAIAMAAFGISGLYRFRRGQPR